MGFVKWMTSPGVFHDNHLHLLTASLSLFFSVSLVFWLPGKSIDFALSVCMCGCIWHINLTTLVIGEQVCAWNNWRHKSQLSPAPNNAVWWMQCLQPANYAAQLKWRTQTVVSGEVWASKEQKQERNRVYSSLLIELSAAKRVQKKKRNKKNSMLFPWFCDIRTKGQRYHRDQNKHWRHNCFSLTILRSEKDGAPLDYKSRYSL